MNANRSVHFPLLAPALIYVVLIAIALVWVSTMQGNAEKWIFCVILTIILGAPLSFLGQWMPLRIDNYGILNTAVAGIIQCNAQ